MPETQLPGERVAKPVQAGTLRRYPVGFESVGFPLSAEAGVIDGEAKTRTVGAETVPRAVSRVPFDEFVRGVERCKAESSDRCIRVGQPEDLAAESLS